MTKLLKEEERINGTGTIEYQIHNQAQSVLLQQLEEVKVFQGRCTILRMNASGCLKSLEFRERYISVLEKLVNEQGIIVRNMKTACMEKFKWTPQVEILLELKSQLAALKAMRPSAPVSISTSSKKGKNN